MNLQYININKTSSLLPFLLAGLFSSCIVYQTAPYDDGIYAKRTNETRVVVADSNQQNDYESNYFTKELERIDQINGTDILTDIETYSSYSDDIPDDTNRIEREPTGRAWGYNDNDDVVINVNLNDNWGFGRGGFGWGGFYDPWFGGSRFGWGWNNWGWGGGLGWNRWGGLGWNRWGWNNNWGWGSPGFGWGGGWYYPQSYFRTNGFYAQNRNYRYGRRTAYNNSRYNRSATSNRRVSSVYQNRTGSYSRRSTSNSRSRTGVTQYSNRRTTSTANNSSSNSRRSTTANRNTSSSRRNSSSYRNSSNSRRSSSFSRSSGSRGRSSGVSRRSSSRRGRN